MIRGNSYVLRGRARAAAGPLLQFPAKMVVTTGGLFVGKAGPQRSRHRPPLAIATRWWSVKHVQTRLGTIIPSRNFQHIREECWTRLPLTFCTFLIGHLHARGVGPQRLHPACSRTAVLTRGFWGQKRSYLWLCHGGPSMCIYIYKICKVYQYIRHRPIFICNTWVNGQYLWDNLWRSSKFQIFWCSLGDHTTFPPTHTVHNQVCQRNRCHKPL